MRTSWSVAVAAAVVLTLASSVSFAAPEDGNREIEGLLGDRDVPDPHLPSRADGSRGARGDFPRQGDPLPDRALDPRPGESGDPLPQEPVEALAGVLGADGKDGRRLAHAGHSRKKKGRPVGRPFPS